AAQKKWDWFLTPSDWDMLARLSTILEVFHKSTLELSKAKEPTICKVLPLYKLIQCHLQNALNDLELEVNSHCLGPAIQAGLNKLEAYIICVTESNYVLLGASNIRIAYFKDTLTWEPAIAQCGCVLLDHLYDVYSDDSAISGGASMTLTSVPGKFDHSSSIFVQAIQVIHTKAHKSSPSELESYFSGAYPCLNGNALERYKVPTLAQLCLISIDDAIL
ncbi:hypothetical protein K439DRAFT_1371956, partial [Ramaria rubella]